MNTHSNAQLVREAYARWNACKGTDLNLWDEYTTEDLCLRSLGSGNHGLDFSCPREGRAQMHEYLKDLTDAFELQHWTMEETISQGDKVVGIGKTAWKHRARGIPVETPVVIVCRFRDGKVCEFSEYYDTASFAAATI
ncbi:nuclear transport factor 2 family protein [Primorskyibacter sp. S87]|uniref:nuclear transport factor 2 family protein n=1 Tax=Primorskyibacter sp. S87 TaxID=3415126 RepID=UPI003C7A8D0A